MKSNTSRLLPVVALIFAALLSACGGGGASGVPGFTAPEGGTSGTGVSGGTTATGISSGQVSSFGSVRVNGRTYLTSADDPDIATNFIGPAPGFGEPDLAVGMLVQVLWDQESDTGPRRAQRISYLPELIGTVTADFVESTKTLEVAGRTVQFSSITVFDDVFGRNTAGTATLSGPELLTADSDQVEVSGFLSVTDPDTGESFIEATRVARVGTAAAEVVITAVVTNASAGAFNVIDASGRVLSVSFDAGIVDDDTLFVDSGSTQLLDGEAVRITGERDGNSIVAVTRIGRPLADLQVVDPDLPDEVEGEIAGPITQGVDTDNRFRIANQRIAFDADTVFLADSAASDITVGRRASATGTVQMTANGGQELLAAAIFIEPDAEVEVEDLVATAAGPEDSDGNRTFELRMGLTVVIRPNSLLKDDTDASEDGRLDPATIAPGDFVEIKGFFDPAGRLVAVKLERDDDEDECELVARVADSELINGQRHYTIANRPGLVIVDITDDSADEKVAPGGIGEFESDEPGNCAMRPTGFDINDEPIDAGFFADDVDGEDADDLDDDEDDD